MIKFAYVTILVIQKFKENYLLGLIWLFLWTVLGESWRSYLLQNNMFWKNLKLKKWCAIDPNIFKIFIFQTFIGKTLFSDLLIIKFILTWNFYWLKRQYFKTVKFTKDCNKKRCLWHLLTDITVKLWTE